MTSCKSQTQTTKTIETCYVDRYTVDTVVKYDADTASLAALIECDSLGNVLMAQIETLQGQRVSVAPQIIYRNVVDANGQIRRTAYFAVLAMADSLQNEVSILKEKISLDSSRETETEVHRTDIRSFLWGMILGAALSFILIIFIKK